MAGEFDLFGDLVASEETGASQCRSVPWNEFFGKRAAFRSTTDLPVTVEGARGSFQAVVRDISRGGVLLELHDSRLSARNRPTDLLRYAAMVAAALGRGFRLRIGDAFVSPRATVVRMAAAVEQSHAANLLGCRFDRPLTAAECAQLGLSVEPDRPPSA